MKDRHRLDAIFRVITATSRGAHTESDWPFPLSGCAVHKEATRARERVVDRSATGGCFLSRRKESVSTIFSGMSVRWKSCSTVHCRTRCFQSVAPHKLKTKLCTRYASRNPPHATVCNVNAPNGTPACATFAKNCTVHSELCCGRLLISRGPPRSSSNRCTPL